MQNFGEVYNTLVFFAIIMDFLSPKPFYVTMKPQFKLDRSFILAVVFPERPIPLS